jgi:hypothetical protein
LLCRTKTNNPLRYYPAEVAFTVSVLINCQTVILGICLFGAIAMCEVIAEHDRQIVQSTHFCLKLSAFYWFTAEAINCGSGGNNNKKTYIPKTNNKGFQPN